MKPHQRDQVPAGSLATSKQLMSEEKKAGNSNGTVVGVGRLHLNSPSEAQVRYMAIDETFRDRGVGSRILSGLEDRARSKSVMSVVLNARDSAINFYRRRGYVVEGSAEILFGEVRHFRMRKELGPRK